MTTDQYLRMPETLAPEELVYGFVRNAPAPSPGHQWALGELFIALSAHVEQHTLGKVWPAPIDVVLDRERHLVVQPDIVYVSNERMRLVTDRVWGPPDLVVEVLSPNPRIGRLDERIAWFAEYGVRECWLVRHDPGEIEVVAFAGRALDSRTAYGPEDPIVSQAVTGFRKSLNEILR
jgi:Uma2 family endonuclease